MGHDVFTSGEVAKICSVSSPTVIKWIDNGTLKGFRIPGSKARRVARKDLLAFMNRHGMPLEKLDGIKTKILVIDDDVNFCKMLKREFDLDGSLDALIVQNAFRAGAMLDEFKPDFILIDILLGGIDGREVCKFLRQNTELKHTKVIGMSGIYLQNTVIEQEDNGFDGFLKKPFKFNQLKELIHSLQSGEIKPLTPEKKRGVATESETGK